MAEPIGLASGILALATFTFQCSVSLFETVNSFRSHPKRVRDLLEELEALSAVLGPLADILNTTSDVDLSSLNLPLLRCGNACKEFQQEIIQCSSRSTGNRTSFRDWAKLTYMGDDIDGFRRLLAGYKATINIALTDANLRQASVTAENLEDYKHLIQDAKDDLEARLEVIDLKLGQIVENNAVRSDVDAAELQSMREERLSTEKCLLICTQLSEHIDQIQLMSDRSGTPGSATSANTLPETVTNEGLQECKNSLIQTAAKLEKHMQDIMDRMLSKSKIISSEQDAADLTRLRDEWKTARQCLDICSRADTHVKENVSVIENYGLGDSLQFMVSTNGQILHGKNRGLGWRTRQVGGYVSDESVQQLSRDIASTSLHHVRVGSPLSRDDTTPASGNRAEGETTAAFKERYGSGFKLKPMASPNSTPSVVGSGSD
ncbi:uncharacterized protein N7443_008396 [Penicillium atrosanguineum]|uniref:uncharacterized protein n=1 Tax=Penicillium atrosanguineum TaxID=1132637 RepID=UPI00239D7CEC|nr:uncharacterized protein N7443_008396 [Penicillium atrosanguineum]KAJ5292443.1 hypothetical protein N7443_008396 [Penicillium atrosanguineum]